MIAELYGNPEEVACGFGYDWLKAERAKMEEDEAPPELCQHPGCGERIDQCPGHFNALNLREIFFGAGPKPLREIMGA